MDRLLAEFIVESRENLEQLDRDLVLLEADPDNKAIIGRIFRCVHTIKGTCGFLSYPVLESVAHAGETLLSRLRDGRLRCTDTIANALLAMADAIKMLLNGLEATGEEPDTDFDTLVDTLAALASSPQPIVPSVAREPAPPTPTVQPEDVPAGKVEQPVASAMVETTVRLDVRLLDALLNLVGELVLTRNQMLDPVTRGDHTTMNNTVRYLDTVTTQLQRTVMKTRMQPLSTLFNKFNRVVRDLAQNCGKQVRLVLEGGDTELDRTLVEAIRDPLTHLVRNAVDHGLESPSERVEHHKPPVGCLTLSASHRSGQVHLEIVDDGRGINLAKVRARAIERGLISTAQAETMTDKDAQHLIFLPGFSTADTVSSLSGRGVGMDVVLSNVARIGGTIDVESRLGAGTTFRLKIPLTLAIIPVLIVTSGPELYAIPQVNLIELLRLEEADYAAAVEPIQGAPLLRLRGQLLPLIFLERELGREPAAAGPDRVFNIVVLQADVRQFALVVDRVRDVMEIVVKPLGRLLKGISIYAGATLLSDGTLILILDILGLAQRARVVTEGLPEAAATPLLATSISETASSMLMVQTAGADRVVVPMLHMVRVSTIEPGHIEWSAGQEVVQFDRSIIPLVRLSSVLGRAADPAGPMEMVVCQVEGRRFGLVVHHVVDVIEQCIEVKGEPSRAGVRRRVVVNGQTAEELDMQSLLRSAFPWP